MFKKIDLIHHAILIVLALFGWATTAFSQCEPQTTHTTQLREKYGSPDVRDAVDGAAGAYVPVILFNEAGYYRKCRADYVDAHVDSFIWAENGFTATIDFEARAQRDYCYVTKCVEATGHSVPPYGNGFHDVVSDCSIGYAVAGSAGVGGRSASLSIACVNPTGNGISIDYTLSDRATLTQTNTLTVSGTASVGVGGSDTTNLNSSAGSKIRARFTKAAKAGASIEAQIERVEVREGNQSASASDLFNLLDKATITTECHRVRLTEIEKVEIRGNANVTASTSGVTLSTVQIDADVRIVSTVESRPWHQCGTFAEFPTTPRPMTTPGGGGGDTTPASQPSPGGETPGSRPSEGVGADSKGTAPVGGTTTPGEAVAGFWCFVAKPQPGSAHDILNFRVAATSLGAIAFGPTATATPIEVGTSATPVTFNPAVAVDLPPGQWWIDVPLVVSSAGISFVEMSFDATFPTHNTARSAIECIPCPFTVRSWVAGVHTGSNSVNPEIAMAGLDQRIWLEPLRRVRWSGLVPAIVAFVINDPPAGFEWHLEPTIRYDEIQDSYYLTMAPNAAIHVAVTLGYEGQVVTIPVHFTEATPLHD